MSVDMQNEIGKDYRKGQDEVTLCTPWFVLGGDFNRNQVQLIANVIADSLYADVPNE
jgi:hypothetical protein